MILINKISLQQFFNSDMMITDFEEIENQIIIKIRSITKLQPCPTCNQNSNYHQVTYKRIIDDLPLLGKSVKFVITAYKYKCLNVNCKQKIFCENLNGLTRRYRRRSNRCEDLITAIALNTNCESTAFICRFMGINISGDTVIRILLKKASNIPEEECSEIIGVDDWALKKEMYMVQ